MFPHFSGLLGLRIIVMRITLHLGNKDLLLLRKTKICILLVFGSDRSSRSHFMCPSVCPAQVCLEQSKFIILAQIFKQSVRNKSAVSEHFVSTQRAIREQSESNQRAISEHSEHQNKSQYSRSLKIFRLVVMEGLTV